jgi:hypothetical protein
MPNYPLYIEVDKHKLLREKLFKDGKTIKWLLDKSIDDYLGK